MTTCKDEIYKAFYSDDRMKTFFHGHSYTGNPLACAAGIESLDILKSEECRKRIDDICRMNLEFKTELMPYKILGNIRTLGTILAFEIKEGEDNYFNTKSSEISRMAFDQGVLLRPLGNTVYIMPPYCISHSEYDKLKNCIHHIIQTYQHS
jgi:adenosylmethionine-8-amino-7-oxononanoate aminotransferase